MKKVILVLTILIFTSCGSYYKMSHFYNAHKNDTNVTAVQVPRFMFETLKGLSPDMNRLLHNVNELRYIRLRPENDAARATIQNEINQLTNSRFTDLYRNNQGFKRTLVSVRQQDTSIREIIVHTSSHIQNSVLYLSGRFDPSTVKQYAEQGKFDNLTQSITQQYQWNTTVPKSY